MYGTPYIFSIASLAVAGILIRFILLPVFYNLQLTSVYEVSSIYETCTQSPPNYKRKVFSISK